MSKNDRAARAAEALCAWRQAPCVDDGGGRRDRTDDLLLAKQALSQLSYAPSSAKATEGEPGTLMGWLAIRSAVRREGWWAREDLNLRPHAYQARALTS
jgi:hypothetical protein